jgi:hypothetical protein
VLSGARWLCTLCRPPAGDNPPPPPPLLLQGLQERLAEEKAELAHLLQAVQPPLTPGETYRLVPAAFMAQWRAYMQQAGKRALSPNSKAAQVCLCLFRLSFLRGVGGGADGARRGGGGG